MSERGATAPIPDPTTQPVGTPPARAACGPRPLQGHRAPLLVSARRLALHPLDQCRVRRGEGHRHHLQLHRDARWHAIRRRLCRTRRGPAHVHQHRRLRPRRDRIGQRVRVVFKPSEGDGPPLPMFTPARFAAGPGGATGGTPAHRPSDTGDAAPAVADRHPPALGPAGPRPAAPARRRRVPAPLRQLGSSSSGLAAGAACPPRPDRPRPVRPAPGPRRGRPSPRTEGPPRPRTHRPISVMTASNARGGAALRSRERCRAQLHHRAPGATAMPRRDRAKTTGC